MNMKQYDVECPNCGTLNKGLYLEETNGWMICEHCLAESQHEDFGGGEVIRIPVFDIDHLPEFLRRAAG